MAEKIKYYTTPPELMQRKVIKQGPSTMMISLPAPWVKENNIKKGSEIALEIVNNQLVISTKAAQLEKKAVLHIKDEYLDRMLMVKYREGYDEIKVHYENSAVIEQIRDTLRYLLGFEIVDQTAKSCTIKNLSEGSDEDYPTMFRRMMQIMITMGESCLEYAKTGDESVLRVATDLRETLIKLEQFSLRLINKQTSHSLQKKSLEFFYVWNIGTFGRKWSSLARYCRAKKDVAFFAEIVSYMKIFQHTLQTKEVKDIILIKQKLYTLRPVGASLLEDSKNKMPIFYLMRILNRIYEISLTF
jgi:phosphate uptake regulator